MLYSALYFNDYIYLSFHAEQVYQNFNFYNDGNYLTDSNLGYFATELKIDTIERVRHEIESLNTQTTKKIVIDCNLITESRNPNSEFDRIIQFVINKDLSFSLLRVGVKLYEDFKLKRHLQTNNQIIVEKNETEYTNFFLRENEIDTTSFDSFIFDLYQKNLAKEIKDNYLEENKKIISNSSNVYLPKYINIKKFIEQKKITYFGLYLLCKTAINNNLIPKINENKDSRKTKLFFQSLNGAYLASVISKIAVIDMAYIDHVGPINKIYRTILKNNFEFQNNYLIMSDVICMGTEEKIVKSLIEYENSFVVGNLSIVKIEPIKIKKENEKTCSLFTLSRENNIEIGYKINTEFE